VSPWTVHIAGTPVGPIQACVACGFILEDATPWLEGRVAVPDGQDASHRWWPVGALIGTDKQPGERGGCTFVLEEGRPLDADERMCAGAN
jgi:hypothetical protein